MNDLAKRLREACNGHPAAKIPWPHRLLHDAADEIEHLTKQSGKRIVTREDAAQYILDLPTGRQNRQAWQTAAKALMGGAGTKLVTHYVVSALSMDGGLGDDRAVPRTRPRRSDDPASRGRNLRRKRQQRTG